MDECFNRLIRFTSIKAEYFITLAFVAASFVLPLTIFTHVGFTDQVAKLYGIWTTALLCIVCLVALVRYAFLSDACPRCSCGNCKSDEYEYVRSINEPDWIIDDDGPDIQKRFRCPKCERQWLKPGKPGDGKPGDTALW